MIETKNFSEVKEEFAKLMFDVELFSITLQDIPHQTIERILGALGYTFIRENEWYLVFMKGRRQVDFRKKDSFIDAIKQILHIEGEAARNLGKIEKQEEIRSVLGINED